MSLNNVTPLIKPKSSRKSTSALLDSVKTAIKAWRASKTKQNEKIPAHIWDQIFALVELMPASKVFTTLSIKKSQFDTETGTIFCGKIR